MVHEKPVDFNVAKLPNLLTSLGVDWPTYVTLVAKKSSHVGSTRKSGAARRPRRSDLTKRPSAAPQAKSRLGRNSRSKITVLPSFLGTAAAAAREKIKPVPSFLPLSVFPSFLSSILGSFFPRLPTVRPAFSLFGPGRLRDSLPPPLPSLPSFLSFVCDPRRSRGVRPFISPSLSLSLSLSPSVRW